MRRILVALGALLAATVLLPAASTSAAPSFSCQYEAMDSTADVNVTAIGTQVLVDAVWLQRAHCPLQPLVDGQLVRFHETSLLSRSRAGELTGSTRIVVNPPRSLPFYFNGVAVGTFNIQSGGYVAINWATLSTTSNGLKMVDPHQYIL
ncbi:MAG TPA: hypothetical protein VFY10_00995, partial [Dehalococcoidia bacterium]|nr:hypothetical protein [Dehalococcoidia bacterium]